MTLAELNGHLDLVQQLQKTEELIQGLWNAAVPGAQKLDGMPHASGVNDKVGVLGAEIADMETQRDALKEQIARSEETIAVWIAGIEDNTTRLVFRLRFIRGMPWKTVASVLGGRNSEDGVKSICYRFLGTCPAMTRADAL